MREFKFRVWDKELKQYNTPNVHHLVKEGDVLAVALNLDIHKICGDDRFVIQQCTELKDKNGKEIYEGDFIKYEGMSLKYPFIGIVKFQDCAFIAFEEMTGCRIQLGVGLKLEIVGNIFENPELL